MIIVSVVIPVFNAEKYISESIESLLAQTLVDCEFIFVNDGSTDNSRFIIEDYQKKDNRILLINQDNQGVSAARNNGITIAQGDYIGFVDADDYIDKDMYEKLFISSLGCDVVISNFIAYQDGKKSITRSSFPTNIVYNEEFIQNKIIPFCIKCDDLNSSCNKIFKRELINKNNLIFPKGIVHGEDAQFVLKAFNVAKNAVFTEYAGYHYREVLGSASRSIIDKNYFQIAIDTYSIDYKNEFNLKLTTQEVQKCKGVRLINSVIALIHVYFSASNIPLQKKYKIVKMMVTSDIVQNVLQENWHTLSSSGGRYQRFILDCIKSKSIFKLYIATTYSNYKK